MTMTKKIDLGAHALSRAKFSDSGNSGACFTGANNARANKRIARLSPQYLFVGSSTANAERRAARYVDRNGSCKVTACNAARHAERMARFVDTRGRI